MAADDTLEAKQRQQLRQTPYSLDEPRRALALQTIREVANHRKWKLWAVHVRSNHVHVVVSASARPEKVMIDFKAWTSRRIREAFDESSDRDRWTQHGSTRWLNGADALQSAITYVLEEQGERMAYFDGREAPSNEPDA